MPEDLWKKPDPSRAHGRPQKGFKRKRDKENEAYDRITGGAMVVTRFPKAGVIMPFGKHKGVALGEIPDDYLSWLAREPWVFEGLAKAARSVLVCRAREAVRRRYREMEIAPETSPKAPWE